MLQAVLDDGELEVVGTLWVAPAFMSASDPPTA